MERIDIVNEEDLVIGDASYEEVYRQGLPHRIVHVLIFNDAGEMAIQLRSKQKTFCPEHWSTAVGGHVQSGETYMEAAHREFKEELGVHTDLVFIRKDRYVTGTGQIKFVATFATIYNGPFKPNSEEVADVRYVSRKELQSMLVIGEKFHPELLFLLQDFKR